jgi:hypothetical protein
MTLFILKISEIEGLTAADVFDFQPQNELPYGSRLLNAIWSYKRKQQPDLTLLKHKSQVCVDWSQQQHGIDYWDTYSPVVHWSTVLMVLVLSAILGLKSRQVDYTQAFPQAPLDNPIFMRIPQGWQFDPVAKKLVQFDDPKSIDHTHFIHHKRNL